MVEEDRAVRCLMDDGAEVKVRNKKEAFLNI